MSSATEPNPPRRPLPLAVLNRSLQEAREGLRERRHGQVAPADLADARHALVAALEEYTTALEQRRLPVPYALHAELELHRGLFGR